MQKGDNRLEVYYKKQQVALFGGDINERQDLHILEHPGELSDEPAQAVDLERDPHFDPRVE